MGLENRMMTGKRDYTIWVVLVLSTVTVIRGEEILARPSLGVVFNKLSKIQNSGSNWRNLFQLPDFTKLKLPNKINESIEIREICLGPVQENIGASERSRRVLRTLEDICRSFRPVISKYNKQKSVLVDSITRMQGSIQTLILNGTKIKESRQKRAPLEIIGSISQGLFGTAMAKDVALLNRNLLGLQGQTNQSFDRIRRHQTHMESAMLLQDERINDAYQALDDTQKSINKVISGVRDMSRYVNTKLSELSTDNEVLHSVIRLQSQLTAGIMKSALSQIDTLQIIHEQTYIYLQALQTLSENLLPVSLITAPEMQRVLQEIDYHLVVTYPTFSVAVRNLGFYYRHPVEVFLWKGHIVVQVDIPLSSEATTFDLYEIHAIKIPIPRELTRPNKYGFTQVEGYSRYFGVSHDKEYHLLLDNYELSHCQGDLDYKICSPFMVQTARGKQSCTLGLFLNDIEMVKKHCVVQYYEDVGTDTTVMTIGRGQVLLSTTDCEWVLACDKKSPTYVTQCHFCIITLNCSCSLRSKFHLIPPTLENCDDIQSTTAIEYPLNILAIQTLIEEYEPLIINNSLNMNEIASMNVPILDVQEIDSSQVAELSGAKALDLRKMVALAKDQKDIYLTKADIKAPNGGVIISALSSAYGDLCSILVVLLQVTTTGLVLYNFHQVRQLAALLSMIRASEGANIHDDQRGLLSNKQGCPHTLYYQFLHVVYPLIFLITAIGLYVLGKHFIRYVYRWAIEHRHVRYQDGPPRDRRVRTKIYLQVSSRAHGVTVYVSSVFASAHHIGLLRPATLIKMKLIKGCLGFHKLKMKWGQLKIYNTETEMRFDLPEFLQVPFGDRNIVQEILTCDYKVKIYVGEANFYSPAPYCRVPEIEADA